MSPTSEFLEVSVIFYKKRSKSSKFAPKTYECFLLVSDSISRAYCVFNVTTVVLKPRVIWCLMRLMSLKRSKLIL
jgi:hypothetical protein